ncbi:MAG: spore maturation protein [Okeania sp. SIO2G4]|uniref:nucleoside recognition domain-containing protein n=1 Tax=unclassified Okeania TaxID=2634635 RepID=UPI0013BBF991|nr:MULTISPECIES: spore maturation protein [unclassified Okeania]NEP73467.1 spore maturation protein [Okeania sp. SIO2G5]NEP94185.1 spore maturation protein [Okeania sp. SIO2F5]NEQ92139.1 spore maturation protein [Okeania sp. SIO2G4]
MNKSQVSPINSLWLFMIVSATVIAAYNGRMTEITEASFESVKNAVTLAIGLIGSMALWLGIIQVVETAGGMIVIARLIRPVMVKLFPDIPASHSAMSAIILNIAANALGLGNAATPMGLKAMVEMDKLNPEKGTATDAMCLFLAINTSSVTIIPISVITVRASAGVTNPGDIILPAIFATFCSTITAIFAAKFFARRQSIPSLNQSISSEDLDGNDLLEGETNKYELTPPNRIGKLIFASLIGAFLGAVIYHLNLKGITYIFSFAFLESVSNWLLPILICSFLLFGYFRGVKVYEKMTEGAKAGFEVAVRIIPFMVAIFVAIGMFRASGALDILAVILSPITNLIGMPTEALPMALIRPLSGSGAFGIMSEIVTNEPNSFLSYLVSTMQGSTETTFYVLAVYFGSVGIKKTRYALPAALCADVAGILASLVVCRMMF